MTKPEAMLAALIAVMPAPEPLRLEPEMAPEDVTEVGVMSPREKVSRGSVASPLETAETPAEVVTPIVLTVPPDVGTVLHVPSPRQKVAEEAPDPPFRFATGRLPVTSVARLTAPPTDQVEVAVRRARPVPVRFSRAARSSASEATRLPAEVIGPPENTIPAVGFVMLTDVTALAQTPSPRQNVEELADVPLFRLATGRFPVTSELSETAPPADQVEVAVRRTIPVVVSPSTAARSSARASVMLPEVVIGPPETVIPAEGAVRFTEVTVPAPDGEAQTPSPRQNVVADAFVPPFRFPTGRLPVTSAVRSTLLPTVHVEVAVRRARPVPFNPSRAARSSDNERAMLPEVVTGPPETVMPAEGAVRFTEVTALLQEPSPRRNVEADATPEPRRLSAT